MVAPVLQVAVPVPAPGAVEMTLWTQVPVAVFAGFGSASGAPKKQPELVQWRSPKVGVPTGVEQDPAVGTSPDVVGVRLTVSPEQEAILL